MNRSSSNLRCTYFFPRIVAPSHTLGIIWSGVSALWQDLSSLAKRDKKEPLTKHVSTYPPLFVLIRFLFSVCILMVHDMCCYYNLTGSQCDYCRVCPILSSGIEPKSCARSFCLGFCCCLLSTLLSMFRWSTLSFGNILELGTCKYRYMRKFVLRGKHCWP